MKSEHRHHLAENDLGHRLNELAEKLKPYSKHILFGTLGLAVIAIIAVVIVNNISATDRQAWAEFLDCHNASQYEEVAERFEGSTVAQWAWINAGEMQLQDGIEQSFTSRAVAVENLKDAQADFENVLNNPDALPEARERALNGLGRTLETLSDGDTQPAIEAYQQLIDDFPESRFRRWAESRIEELSRPDTQEFYAWYHEQNPDPAVDRPLPDDSPFGPGFNIPPFDSTAPDTSLDADADDESPPPPPDAEGTDGTPGEDGESEVLDTETTVDLNGDEGIEGPSLGPPVSEGPASEETVAPEAVNSDAAAESDDSESESGEVDAETPAADGDPAASDDAADSPAIDDGSTDASDPP